MSIKEQLDSDFKEAFKAKEELTVSVLRMLRAATMNKAIELKKKDEGLSEEETITVIKSEVKKLKDAAEDFEKGGRVDLAEQNQKEIEILKKYLPEEMGEDAIRAIIKKKIEELDLTATDFGRAMGEVMKETKGMAEGNTVRKILQEELSA